MRPCFTFEEIRAIEKQIIESGVPSLILMENAGFRSYHVLKQIISGIEQYEIFIITGKGNNAGDGFVIARHLLIDGYRVNLIPLCDASELKGDAKINFELLLKSGFSDLSFSSFHDINRHKKVIVIDAILGTGSQGSPEGVFAEAIRQLNDLKKRNRKLKIVSVDVPSGLSSGSNLNVIADYTLTMAIAKSELLFGEAKESAGEIHVIDIGTGSEVFNKLNIFGKFIPELSDIRRMYPKRKKSSYKYSNGRALIIGGSRRLSGAIIMSSLSALRSGCGAVITAYPESISSHLGRKLYEAIKLPLNETEEGSISSDSYDKIMSRIADSDAVLIGPGLSLNEETGELVRNVIMNSARNIIIDADAITHICDSTEIFKKRSQDSEVILTPHIGEFSRLAKVNTSDILRSRFELVRNFCREFNVNVVLKSETSISVLKTGEIYINPTGSEVLATAGSGDVLSGIMVSILAQTKNPMVSMLCANYVHGMTADIYSVRHLIRQTALQRDIIGLIPEALSIVFN